MKFFVLAVACIGLGKAEVGRYTWGNALVDPTEAGPDGKPYPVDLINRLVGEGEFGAPRGLRRGRMLHPTVDPASVSKNLLNGYLEANSGIPRLVPEGRSMKTKSTDNSVKMDASVKMSTSSSTSSESASFSSSASTPSSSGASSCQPGPPARLCKTRYNTTAPMYGVSLTSGQPVTIVQKFPDLLQQVIFEVCESDECDIVHGSCVQTYVPYLFLVIPLGPVTLTGQDYVLVESGCVCQPKYGLPSTIKSPLDAISGGSP
ncbi:uncharacterized protein [Macrobrachium rosenbergii]|uniref:uncharacterized protein n=1 Tax=Macrobrachium rosenbergii TaxID=79674 RepID=UPI0034D7456D